MAEELTVTEASRRYNVSGGHLTRLAQAGTITARRVGPLWLLDKESLENWITHRPKRGGYRGRKAHSQQEAEDSNA